MKDNPLYEFIKLQKEHNYYLKPGIGRLVLLIKGELSISFSTYNGNPMHSKQMVFLPTGYEMILTGKQDSFLLTISLENKIHFCDCFTLEQLEIYVRRKTTESNTINYPYMLKMNKIFEYTIQQVHSVIESGYKCRVYFNNKTQEILMLMRVYFTREQLAFFFKDILSKESQFSNKIINNYHRFLTFSALAAFMGMSLQSFERRFQQVFGQPGYKWMNERRKQKIFHAIAANGDNFKELSFQFGFSSPAAFNNYCKTHLGNTPGKIRKFAKKGNEKELP